MFMYVHVQAGSVNPRQQGLRDGVRHRSVPARPVSHSNDRADCSQQLRHHVTSSFDRLPHWRAAVVPC